MSGEFASSGAVLLQLALWPPHREIILSSPSRPRMPRIVARLQILELTILTLERQTAGDDGTSYPCTYPGYARGPEFPMGSATRLANHRFATHGIRSTNEESIKRQQRRDKHRAEERGAAPEYIDRERIREQVGKAFPGPTSLQVFAGSLNPGEREYVRRRIAHLVAEALPREIRRAPAEICLAIAEIAAAALTPSYPKIVDGRKSEVMMERLTQLYTKSAVAV